MGTQEPVVLDATSRRPHRRATTTALAAGLVTIAMIATSAAASEATTSVKQRATGTVDVLYAGSLLRLMQNSVDPAFHSATGYTVSGISGGSTALANQIKSKTVVGDVFISASPTADAALMGASNGKWISSYDSFGTSSLVLGYNPSSRFATAVKSKPWYDVVDTPGFLLGRTDPKTDPKGVLSVDALDGVALSYDLPALGSLATSTSNVFPETSLVGRLQAGQLDGGFFYEVEAIAAKIRTVPLVSTGLSALYTIAILNHAPHGAAAKAFVKFLLGATGRSILRKNGIVPIVPPKVS